VTDVEPAVGRPGEGAVAIMVKPGDGVAMRRAEEISIVVRAQGYSRHRAVRGERHEVDDRG
jgi:hypothetical protein